MFTPEEIQFLEKELNREDMQCFTAISMAKKDLANGKYDTVISRLKIDYDKWEQELKQFIRKFQPKFEGCEMVGYERVE